MAAYATIARAVALYGTEYVTVSCDRDRDGAIDTAAAEAMLDVATAMINSYLLGKVPLPLTTVPLDLEKYCIDIMIYEMCPSASVRTEEKTARYEQALSFLRGVRDNKIRLTVGDAASPQPAGGPNLTAGPTMVPAVEMISDLEIEPGVREYTRDKLRAIM